MVRANLTRFAGRYSASIRLNCAVWVSACLVVALVSVGCSPAGARMTPQRRDPVANDQVESRYQALLVEARAEERRQYLALAERARSGLRAPGATFDYTNNFVPQPWIPQGNMTDDEYRQKLREEWEKEQRRADEQRQRMRDQAASGYVQKANEVMQTGPFCEFGGPSTYQLRRAAEEGKTSLGQLRQR